MPDANERLIKEAAEKIILYHSTWFDFRELQAYLRVSYEWLSARVRDHDIPFDRLPELKKGGIRFNRAQIDRWFAKTEVETRQHFVNHLRSEGLLS